MDLGKNVAWSMAEPVIRLGVASAVNIFIARAIGPHDYGVFAVVFVVAGWITTFMTLGLDVEVVREVATNPAKAGESLGSALVLRSAAAFCACLCVFVFAMVAALRSEEGLSPLWACVMVTMILIPFQTLGACLGNSFQANLRADLLTQAQLSGLLIGSVCRVIGITAGLSLTYFVVCHVIEYVCSTLVAYSAYKKHLAGGVGKWRWNSERAAGMLAAGKLLFCSALVSAALSGMGVVFLKTFSSESQVGYYSVALRLVLVLQFIPTAVCHSFLPLLAKLHEAGDSARLVEYETELFRLLWLFGYLAAGGFFFTGDLLIPLLFGSQFAAAAAPFKLLALMLIPLSVGAARVAYFSKTRNYGRILASDLAACLTSVICGLILIRSHGAIGAAAAALMAAAVGYLLVPYFMLKGSSDQTGHIMRAAFFPFPNHKVLFARLR